MKSGRLAEKNISSVTRSPSTVDPFSAASTAKPWGFGSPLTSRFDTQPDSQDLEAGVAVRFGKKTEKTPEHLV